MLIRVRDTKDWCSDFDWFLYTNFQSLDELYRHIDWMVHSDKRFQSMLQNEIVTLLDYCNFVSQYGDIDVILIPNPVVLDDNKQIAELKNKKEIRCY